MLGEWLAVLWPLAFINNENNDVRGDIGGAIGGNSGEVGGDIDGNAIGDVDGDIKLLQKIGHCCVDGMFRWLYREFPFLLSFFRRYRVMLEIADIVGCFLPFRANHRAQERKNARTRAPRERKKMKKIVGTLGLGDKNVDTQNATTVALQRRAT